MVPSPWLAHRDIELAVSVQISNQHDRRGLRCRLHSPTGAANVPSPFPSITESLPVLELRTIRSSFPSPFRSPVATAAGVPLTERCGGNSGTWPAPGVTALAVTQSEDAPIDCSVCLRARADWRRLRQTRTGPQPGPNLPALPTGRSPVAPEARPDCSRGLSSDGLTSAPELHQVSTWAVTAGESPQTTSEDYSPVRSGNERAKWRWRGHQ